MSALTAPIPQTAPAPVPTPNLTVVAPPIEAGLHHIEPKQKTFDQVISGYIVCQLVQKTAEALGSFFSWKEIKTLYFVIAHVEAPAHFKDVLRSEGWFEDPDSVWTNPQAIARIMSPA